MVNKGNGFTERRKHPRVKSNIPLKICGGEVDAVAEAKNLSRSGAFCRVNKAIEPMTKLKIQLLLSYKKSNKMVTKKIDCEGVVVRCDHQPGDECYDTAIYFNDIKEKDIGVISEYVNCMLHKEGHPEG